MTATVRGISVDGRQGSLNEEKDREYSLVYKVVTDDRNDGPEIVMTAAGIPLIGSVYVSGNDFDPDAVVINKAASQGDSPWEWEVEVTFSTVVDSDPEDEEENPLLRPADVSYSFASRRIIPRGHYSDPLAPSGTKDFEVAIEASNGEKFDPQPEVDLAEPVLSISKNVATINAADLMSLANAVNSDFFLGAEPRQLKLDAPQATRQWNKTVGYYWQVSYAIRFRYDTWDIQLLNQGTYYWSGGRPANPTSKTPKTVKDDGGNPTVINLTTSGDLNTTSTPTFTRLRFFREINFSSLGLV